MKRKSIPRNHRSHRILEGKINLATSAMFGGCGWDRQIMRTAGLVAVAAPHLGLVSTCHVHVPQLVTAIREGCIRAQFVPGEVSMSTVNDNTTQGHIGGYSSLPSRNIGADGLDASVGSHGYDALIVPHVCDKAGPAGAIALMRLGMPGMLVSGGTIRPNCHLRSDGSTSMNHIGTVYVAASAAALNECTTAEAVNVINNSTRSPGGCGIMASFNTWGIGMEALGLMPLGSSSIPGDDIAKMEECRKLGGYLANMFETGMLPKDLVTMQSLGNALKAIAAVGGSTNAVMHLRAVAIEAGVHGFTLSHMQKLLQSTPIVANFGPRGPYTMLDLHNVGGTRILFRHLLDIGVIDGDVMTVMGNTIGVLLDGVPTPKQMNIPTDFISSKHAPFREYADLQIGTGNLGTSVLKIADGMDPVFSGPAVCFDSPEELLAQATADKVKEGNVVVLRYQGPAAKGMPELLVISAVLKKLKRLALVTDGRMSGVSGKLFMCIHSAPEAWIGGPIALIEDGDIITLNAKDGTTQINVTEEEFSKRRSEWRARQFPDNHPRYLRTFCKTTAQADQGCVSLAAFPEYQPT